jgi:ABC-type antimicrobial peptide transport system permease subunit
MQETPSILAGQGAQDQVILPTRVAFGICVRGIRTRVGRSFITLSGVALGIAFLMAVISGFEIKKALRQEAHRARDVDRRVAVLRSEVGRVRGAPFLVILAKPRGPDVAVVEALRSRGAEVTVTADAPPPGGQILAAARRAKAVLLLGEEAGPWLAGNLGPLRGVGRLLTFGGVSESLRQEAAGAGLEVKTLTIELRADEIERAQRREEQARYRMIWIVVVSLLITVGGITNAMLMSVTERFREIATMKCLGALSTFVVKLFLIESSLMGLAGSLAGCAIGVAFSLLAYSYTFEFGKVLVSVDFATLAAYGAFSILAGVILAVVAGIYPARVAARMIPAAALSSHV